MVHGLGLAAAALLVAVPLCSGGGGDNDSPYNLPSVLRDAGNDPPALATGWGKVPAEVVVACSVGPSAVLKLDCCNPLGAKVVIERAVIQPPIEKLVPAVVPDSGLELVSVHVPAGETAQAMSVEVPGDADHVVLQGTMVLSGDYPLVLAPSGMPTKGQLAFLVIGPLGPTGLTKILHAVPLDVGAGMDLTALRDEQLAAVCTVPGLGATLVLASTGINAENGAVTVSIEATALFPIAKGAEILVETCKL